MEARRDQRMLASQAVQSARADREGGQAQNDIGRNGCAPVRADKSTSGQGWRGQNQSPLPHQVLSQLKSAATERHRTCSQQKPA